MPIYEFFCPDCNTLYNFFSSRIDTAARPDCPRCERPRLERRPARFAAITRSAGGDDDFGDDFAGDLDEERLGAAFESVVGEMEAGGADPDDPRQMAGMLRRVGAAAGLEPGPKLEEMLHRLEAGDDPEGLEEEMDGALDGGDGDDPLAELFRRKRSSRPRRPRVDDELYFL